MTALTLADAAALPRWVAWRTELRDAKPTKVPHSPDGGRAKADDPATWGTRGAAETRAVVIRNTLGPGGVGIELGTLDNGRMLCGLDLDTCIEADDMAPWATEIVERLGSYAETSPSGTGAKVFFTAGADDVAELKRAGLLADGGGKQFKRATGSDHPPAIEVYTAGRFFAVTDAHLPDTPADVRPVPMDTLRWLLTEAGPAFAADGDDEANAVIAAQQAGDRPKQRKTAGKDRSRSGVAFGKALRVFRDGGTFEDVVAALEADPETADWLAEKGKANGGRELRRMWEKVQAKGPALPIIRILPGQLHAHATASEAAMIAAGLPIYQRGNDLVRPNTRQVPAAHGRTTLAAGLGVLNAHALIDALCGVAEYQRYDARAEEWLQVNPPRAIADILLSRHGHWQVPTVAGVVTTPTMRADGSILCEPGYDPATRLYHAKDDTLRLDPATADPTRQNAERALGALAALLAEFPFVGIEAAPGRPERTVSGAVALSAIITPVIRGALAVAPMHAFRANTAGSGKSYLADVASAVATGRPCPVISAAPGDDAETEKRLGGLLLAGFPIVSLDNVNGELGGDLLCQAIERPLVRLRPLGASTIVEIESRATLFATGNQMRVRGDMTRRTLLCDLDAGMERPETRQFSSDPVATVLANRGRFVSAALIVVRAYVLAGCPGRLPVLASFEDWSGLVRSALVWLGCADPASSMEKAREDDPELADLREVMTLWRDAFGHSPHTVRGAITEASERVTRPMPDGTTPLFNGEMMPRHPELHDAMLRVSNGRSGIVDANRLGYWLRNREGKIVGNQRFRRDGVTHGTARWALAQA